MKRLREEIWRGDRGEGTIEETMRFLDELEKEKEP
jgi:hypothetical protein